jgi:hypothetical protein
MLLGWAGVEVTGITTIPFPEGVARRTSRICCTSQVATRSL